MTDTEQRKEVLSLIQKGKSLIGMMAQSTALIRYNKFGKAEIVPHQEITDFVIQYQLYDKVPLLIVTLGNIPVSDTSLRNIQPKNQSHE